MTGHNPSGLPDQDPTWAQPTRVTRPGSNLDESHDSGTTHQGYPTKIQLGRNLQGLPDQDPTSTSPMTRAQPKRATRPGLEVGLNPPNQPGGARIPHKTPCMS
ncbi:hypothetical protein TIFTF001_044610 [Ficus carica]|uniref:Uncharacterized protein n=1 Tax=Ficus carica TaxID=3494 RepID=A0AA88CU23_FICCA|nr:hypothetical protein TIFTF001_044610 [Ficus carica]